MPKAVDSAVLAMASMAWTICEAPSDMCWVALETSRICCATSWVPDKMPWKASPAPLTTSIPAATSNVVDSIACTALFVST